MIKRARPEVLAVSTEAIQNQALSLEAVGVMTLALSLSQDGPVTEVRLQEFSSPRDTNAGLERALTELEAAGYLSWDRDVIVMTKGLRADDRRPEHGE